jgi:iron complex outermembrane receptor protein
MTFKFSIHLKCILILCLFITPVINAQPLVLSGRVLDENKQPLQSATVYLHETLQAGLTDSLGFFSLKGLSPGVYHLHVQLIGYEKISKWVNLKTDDVFIETELKESIGQLQEVVIEADRNKFSEKESSQPIIQVDKEYIRRNNGNTLMETLDRLPGVSSINTGVGVSKPVIRGLSFQRVLVADQGIKQEGQQWGADHGLEIDQYGVENIEIIKGPGSLLYGSDAIGGVISLGKPNILQEGTHLSESRLIYKTNNHTYGITSTAKGNKKGFVYQARVTGLSYGDYRVPSDTFYYQDTYFPLFGGRLKNTAGREVHSNLMLGVHRKWGYTHLTISNYHQKVGLFTGAIGRVTTDRLFQDGRRNIGLPFQQINHFKVISNTTLQLGKGWLETDLGYQHNDRQERSVPHTHGQPLPDNSTLALRLQLQSISAGLRYFVPKGHRHTLVFGAQLSQQNNRPSGFEFLLPSFSSTQLGIFMLHKYKPTDHLTIHIGARIETARQIADRSIFPFYRRFVFIDSVERNPRVARRYLNYAAAFGLSWDLTRRLHLKLNAAKSYRLPVVPELTANGMHHATFRFEKGNPNLEPEQGYQFDAEFKYQIGGLSMQYSPFLYYFSNYLFQRPTGLFPRVEIDGALYALPSTSQVFEHTQTKAQITGQEVQVEWAIGSGWKISQNMEWVWGENLSTGLPLPYMPPASYFSGLSWQSGKQRGKIRKLYFEANMGIISAQKRVERNEWSTPGYQMLHLSGGFSLYHKQEEIVQVSLQCRNATNTLYFNHLSRYRILNLPEPGVNFIVQLSWKLEKKHKAKS